MYTNIVEFKGQEVSGDQTLCIKQASKMSMTCMLNQDTWDTPLPSSFCHQG